MNWWRWDRIEMTILESNRISRNETTKLRIDIDCHILHRSVWRRKTEERWFERETKKIKLVSKCRNLRRKKKLDSFDPIDSLDSLYLCVQLSFSISDRYAVFFTESRPLFRSSRRFVFFSLFYVRLFACFILKINFKTLISWLATKWKQFMFVSYFIVCILLTQALVNGIVKSGINHTLHTTMSIIQFRQHFSHFALFTFAITINWI